MILHPGILALLVGSLVTLLLMLQACWLGIQILFRWDSSSCSEFQLQLERKTWLVSTLLNYALGFQILSGVFYLATLEDIHRLFVGAMCATGALNANLVGWLVLVVKVILFFAASLWVVINRLDQRTEETPLVRPKYLLLLLITPLVACDLYLQFSYFSGLRPEIITSCCGSLFSEQGESVASELAGMPVRQAMTMFFTSFGVVFSLLLACLVSHAALLRSLLFISAVVHFFSALAAVVSFISLYIYQLPSHHCPFDMLQGHYAYIGYPLYAALFVSTLFALLPGLCHPLRRHPGLEREIIRREKRWLISALAGMLIFLLISVWPMLFSPFVLLGY
ncbi:MAG: hypothetical protein C0619_03115 [Desulfuromonas sp.]|nr:MAG: hypothetical protein C0619_03115 [Desulfuromonas sp.]